VLEALGVSIELPPEAVARCVTELGVGFCFAPAFHPALRYVAAARREIGVPTTFNFLGPLSNPAQPAAMLVGCADRRMAPLLAEVFVSRGQRALVVRGDDGLDEITTTTTSTVWIARDGEVEQVTLDPADLGVPTTTVEALRGGEVEVNARAVRDLVAGRSGAVRDAVLLNSAAALATYDGFTGDLTSAVKAAWTRAQDAIDSGASADLLARWIRRSTELRGH
jgi:anthranilate phosphoribosyltransferase